MKLILLLLLLPSLALARFEQFDAQVVVGDRVVPAASALIQLNSTEGGLAFSRLSTAQRDAIAVGTLIPGLTIFNTDSATLDSWTGGFWTSGIGGVGGNGTDDCLARWNGTAAALLQDSVACITDAGLFTFPSFNVGSSLEINAVLDEDNMVSDSVTALATQQSIKAYVDTTTAALLPIDLTAEVSGILPIANGGTGSATQNFVDLTTNQNIAGEKTFTSNTVINPVGSGQALTITHSSNGNALDITQTGSGFGIIVSGAVSITGNTTQTGNVTQTGDLGVTGLLTVDNLSLNGNEISSTNVNGDIDLNPDGTGGIFKVDAGATRHEIATISEAQTLTNKSISSTTKLVSRKDILANLTTYAATAEDGEIVFATDDGNTYQVFGGNLDPMSKVEATQLAPGSNAIDWSVSDVYTYSIAAGQTYTFSNVPSVKTIIVIVTNTTGGALTVNFPAGIKWPFGTVVTDIPANSANIYTFVVANSTTYVTAVEEMK